MRQLWDVASMAWGLRTVPFAIDASGGMPYEEYAIDATCLPTPLSCLRAQFRDRESMQQFREFRPRR